MDNLANKLRMREWDKTIPNLDKEAADRIERLESLLSTYRDKVAELTEELWETKAEDKIVQVSGFPVGPPEQHAYLLVGVTEEGKVVMSQGDKEWAII